MLQPQNDKEIPQMDFSSPFEAWKSIFDDEIIKSLIEQTLLYAVRDKNIQEFNIDEDELMHFLGILVLSIYHYCLPQNGIIGRICLTLIYLWCLKSECMSRNRLRQRGMNKVGRHARRNVC